MFIVRIAQSRATRREVLDQARYLDQSCQQRIDLLDRCCEQIGAFQNFLIFQEKRRRNGGVDVPFQPLLNQDVLRAARTETRGNQNIGVDDDLHNANHATTRALRAIPQTGAPTSIQRLRLDTLPDLLARYGRVFRAAWDERGQLTPRVRTPLARQFLAAALEIIETPPRLCRTPSSQQSSRHGLRYACATRKSALNHGCAGRRLTWCTATV